MNASETAVVNSVKNLGLLYKEIAALFRSLDHLLGELEYKPLREAVVSDPERKLDSYDYWLPLAFARDYKKGGHKLLSTFIVIDNPWDQIQLPRPLFLLAKIELTKKVASSWEHFAWDLGFEGQKPLLRQGLLHNKSVLFSPGNKKALKKNAEWSDAAFGEVRDVSLLVEPLFNLKDEAYLQAMLMRVGLGHQGQ